MEFSAPLAFAANYPKPDILAVPKSKDMPVQGFARPLPRGCDRHYRVNQARTGLYLLAQSLSHQTFWVPAYHCPALVEPLLAAGKSVRFYALDEALLPDMNQLNAQFADGDVLIVVRFFGFSTGVPELVSWCNQFPNSTTIEDLAHAAFSDQLLGDAGVTSLVKFYPLDQGGEVLLSRASSISLEAAMDTLPSKAGELFRKLKGKVFSSKPEPYRYFKFKRLSRHLTTADTQLLDHSDHEVIASNRRKHFEYLLGHLAHSKRGRPLFPQLEDNAVPYVFPFLLNDAEHFDAIRQGGIQLYRWEELADSHCTVSQDYRSRLVQIPVHQQLTEAQLERIVEVVNQSGVDDLG